MTVLNNCCGCFTLRTGTIFTGSLVAVLSFIKLILVLVYNMKFKAIVIDTLPSEHVKVILAINLVSTILLSILLIVGAIKRRVWFMLPWVTLAIIVIVGIGCTIIYMTAIFFMDGKPQPAVLTLVFGTILTAVYVYFWLVVYSYLQMVREEKSRGPYGRPLYQPYQS